MLVESVGFFHESLDPVSGYGRFKLPFGNGDHELIWLSRFLLKKIGDPKRV